MIYFDNAATSLQKPTEVAEAMVQALKTFGNPGRSFCEPSLLAARTIAKARKAVAGLVQAKSPLQVAFTSGATESLNLVLRSLLTSTDHTITSILEHNSVLRPLYAIGCEISYLNCDEEGNLLTEMLPQLLQSNTKCVVCTHASNVIGGKVNIAAIQKFCRQNNLVFILDASQTLGTTEVTANMADIICFTGHKGLLGPQGTGGIIVNTEQKFSLVKTGGSGSQTFERTQNLAMPDIFEAGTPNGHGLAGLLASLEHISTIGVSTIEKKEQAITHRFLKGVATMENIKRYGTTLEQGRIGVVSLQIQDKSSQEVAMRLWEKAEICVRSGNHCAPLVHRRFATEETGMVRFSFGFYNTLQEVDTALTVLEELAK